MKSRLGDSMRTGVLCLHLIGAGVFGCSEGGPTSESQTPAAPRRSVEAPGAPGVRASNLAELANQPLPSMEEAAKITLAYGAVLNRTPDSGTQIFGTSLLPEKKARIRAALFRMLDSVDTEDQKDFLRAGLMRLAYFQDGVEGSAELSAIAPDGRRFQVIVEAEVAAWTFEVARRGHAEVSN